MNLNKALLTSVGVIIVVAIISISNDYYDVDDRSFHIDFDRQRAIGYY